MPNENAKCGLSTRRDAIKYGGTIVGGGVLAGCVSGNSDSQGTSAADSTGPNETDGSDGEEATYDVCMEPVGCVEFDSVPESIVVADATYIDMLVALGHGDAAESVWHRGRYKTFHYDELDGVSMDLDSLTQLWSDGVSEELFYELDADLHLMDPHWLTDFLDDWSQGDVDEIRDHVAPFFGNVIFRRTDEWHDYRYYTLYEAFEKVADVLQERERFDAIQEIHDELVADIQARLPEPDARPNAALVFAEDEPEEFYPYRLSGNGANKEHFRTLGIGDAFAGTGVSGLSTSDTGSIDYEVLLEVDPDSLLLRYHSNKTRDEWEQSVLSHLEDHDLGSELTAVQNGMVFRGGPIYCGPLHNLFMLERYAKAYFPEEFTEDQLVDRDRLSKIITEGVDE